MNQFEIDIDLQNKFYYLFNGGVMPYYQCSKCGHEYHGWAVKTMTVCEYCDEPVRQEEVKG